MIKYNISPEAFTFYLQENKIIFYNKIRIKFIKKEKLLKIKVLKVLKVYICKFGSK